MVLRRKREETITPEIKNFIGAEEIVQNILQLIVFKLKERNLTISCRASRLLTSHLPRGQKKNFILAKA